MMSTQFSKQIERRVVGVGVGVEGEQTQHSLSNNDAKTLVSGKGLKVARET